MALTCPVPECACRTAHVVATHLGVEALRVQCASQFEAWQDEGRYLEMNPQSEDFTVLSLDIDTCEAGLPDSGDPVDRAKHPALGAVADRVDGDVLDALARLWHLAKGRLDPEAEAEAQARAQPLPIPQDWRPTQKLMWWELCGQNRADVYVQGSRIVGAQEHYCITPGCECNEVLVAFDNRRARYSPRIGGVSVSLAGDVQMLPQGWRGAGLEHAWEMYRQRYPNYRARLARRFGLMREAGARALAKHAAARLPVSVGKPGRNDPCPCGSGSKYKKCCALKPDARSR